MPTGYTAPVQSGEVKDFATFAMQCARAFGALIHMRDDTNATEIREDVVSDYHQNAIQRAEREIERLHALSFGERTMERRKAWAERNEYLVQRKRQDAVQRKRYEAMLAKARAWVPPTPDHEGLRDFMVEQLEKSIEWDCDSGYNPENEVPLTTEEWWEGAMKTATDSLEYHRLELAKEKKRVASRNAWIRALRDSLESEE